MVVNRVIRWRPDELIGWRRFCTKKETVWGRLTQRDVSDWSGWAGECKEWMEGEEEEIDRIGLSWKI